MKPKDILIICAILACIIGVLFLIPANPKSKEMLGQPSPVKWDNVSDDMTAKLEISWQGIAAYSEAKDGCWIQDYLEKKFNIKFKPLYLDWNGYGKRLPLMLVGGDIPDVMWTGDPLGVRKDIQNGFIMEIPYEVILKHMPTYVGMLNKYGKEAWLYSQYDGRNFGLPTFFSGAIYPRISCWRMDWLRNVGIEKVPETIEEMHEALKRMRFDDPDRNGKQDTYGWSPYIGHWSLAFTEIFAAYDVLAFDFMFRDGKVVWGGILPETKEALKLLTQWYGEGLLDPDFIIDTQQNSGESKFLNGRVGYIYPVDSWSNYNSSNPSSLAGKLKSLNPASEIVPGPPLRNQNGERKGRTWGGAGHIIMFGKQLEKKPEKVIRVLKMIEEVSKNEKMYVEASSGKEGLHWTYNPEKGIVLLPPYDKNQLLQKREMLAEGGFSCTFYYPSGLWQPYGIKYSNPKDIEFIEKNKRSEWGMMNVLGKSDVVKSSGRYLADLRQYQMKVYVEIITGKRSIEYFDTFTAEWKRRGGDILTEEANEMYRTMQEIFRKVGADEGGR
jgi:putative aldouronate transport system substrate-binding protein